MNNILVNDAISELIIALNDLNRDGVDIPDNVTGNIMSLSVKLTILNAKSKRDTTRKFNGLTAVPS